MKILVTGGAGYIGTELIHQLDKLDSATEVLIYDNLSRSNLNIFVGASKFTSGKVKFKHADILDRDSLNEAMANANVVYHLAAKVSTPFSHELPHYFDQINHWGTAQVVDLALANKVDKFIYLSSAAIYGSSDQLVALKQTPQPTSQYAISKFNAEKQVSRLESQMEVFTLRLGSVYGVDESMRKDSVINKMMFDAQYRNQINIHGNGEQQRSFVGIKDVANILALVSTDTLKPAVYDLSDSVQSINEVAGILSALYPGLDVISVNPENTLRSLIVAPSPEIKPLLKSSSMEDQLALFKSQFAF